MQGLKYKKAQKAIEKPSKKVYYIYRNFLSMG